jgi:signal transduction histidine kinase
MSIAARFVILISAPMLAAMGLVALDANEVRNERERELRSEAMRLALLVADQQDRIVDGLRQTLLTLAQSEAIRRREPQRCDALLSRIQNQFAGMSSVFAVDAEGTTFCSSHAGRGISVADRSYFKQAMQTGRFAVGEYAIGRVTNGPTLHFAVPISEEDGSITGVVVAGLRLQWLGAHLASKPWAPGSVVVSTDRNGTILQRSPDIAAVGRPLPQDYRAMLTAPQAGVSEIHGSDGARRIVAFVPLAEPPADLFEAVELDPAVGAAPIGHRLGLTLAALALVLGLAAGLAVLLVQVRIRRPIRRLSAILEDWARGNYALPDGRPLAAEFRSLGEKLRPLAATLDDCQREVQGTRLTRARLLQAAGHDLLQPIAGLDTFMRIIGSRPRQPVDPALLARATSEVQRAARVVDMLSEASSLETNGMGSVLQAFPVRDVLRQIGDEYGQEAAERGLRLRIVPSRCEVETDRALLSLIVANLVGNAIRHTERGAVLIGCRRRGATLALQVCDTGVGLPGRKLDSAFNSFRPVGRGGEWGSGLGLWIAKRAAELVSLPLTVRSRAGRGSCFTLEVPLRRPSVPDAGSSRDGEPARLDPLASR